MANVVRIIIITLVGFFSLPAFSAIPMQGTYTSTSPFNSSTGSGSTKEATCASLGAAINSSAYCTTVSWCPWTVTYNAANSSCSFKDKTGGRPNSSAIYGGAPTCPANTVPDGLGACKCGSGYKEVNGACVKDSVCGFLENKPVPGLGRIEADYGKQSASWAASKIGTKGLACTPEECQASGTITGCVSGQGGQGTTVCYVSEPKYTGDSCKKDEPPGSTGTPCPEGTKASATNPALCEPFNTTCPSTHEPSKYKEGVCIPKEDNPDPNTGPKCEDPKDPTKKVPCEGKPNDCPKGYVPSQYVKGVCIPAADGESTDKNGDKVTCKDGKCIVTKPGTPPVEKPKEEFCADNPDNDLCTKKSDNEFGGTCESSFTCKGDVLQCAIAKEQHQRSCQFFVTPTPESGIFENARAEQQEDVLSMTAKTVDLAAHIEADPIITGSCPADMVIPVQGHDIRFPISQFCPYFNYLGLIVMVMTAVTCLRILGKD